jgi:hypothetical protein
MTRRFSLDSQIAEVKREIAQRRSVYPRLVTQRQMSADRADMQVSLMESVLRTLEWLRRNEVRIRTVSEGDAP